MLQFARTVLAALVRSISARRFPLNETVVQTWYAIRVCTLPALAVSIPFGIILALQVGVLAQEVGAVAFTGAGNTLAVVRQASPIITALMLAGVAGSAICADLGSRKIREEIDAMEVMGLSVLERLVVPRTIAIIVVSVCLNGIVMFFTIMTTLSISVVLQDLPPGSYLASVTTLAQLSDLWLSLAKAAVFAIICAMVASYKGLNVAMGPTGVGEAVTSSVVTNFILLFAANFVISQVHTTFAGGPIG
ncbi:ABC transporter permease [Nocardioides caeni]|uniref:ABC transporter permease n=2 Tax=Nocardioides caeni TaxID=574700 RepID=A0A4S8NP91_9ACTN|nr:ABC transporter permease [Nocardioides caeni]